jgi:hypothetical protein
MRSPSSARRSVWYENVESVESAPARQERPARRELARKLAARRNTYLEQQVKEMLMAQRVVSLTEPESHCMQAAGARRGNGRPSS